MKKIVLILSIFIFGILSVNAENTYKKKLDDKLKNSIDTLLERFYEKIDNKKL
jgi:hypothetical protein